MRYFLYLNLSSSTVSKHLESAGGIFSGHHINVSGQRVFGRISTRWCPSAGERGTGEQAVEFSTREDFNTACREIFGNSLHRGERFIPQVLEDLPEDVEANLGVVLKHLETLPGDKAPRHMDVAKAVNLSLESVVRAVTHEKSPLELKSGGWISRKATKIVPPKESEQPKEPETDLDAEKSQQQEQEQQ
jgi:hypothetical protein